MEIHFDLTKNYILNIKYYKIFKINILDINFLLFISSSQSSDL